MDRQRPSKRMPAGRRGLVVAAAAAVVAAVLAGCTGAGTPRPPASGFFGSASPGPTPTAASPTAPEGSVTPTATANMTPNLTPTATTSETPTPTSTSLPTPTPAGPPHWVSAGSLAVARVVTHAEVLPDGRVLVVGNDGLTSIGAVRDDTATAETWDPATGTWSPAAPLLTPRGDFASARLGDGRVLVAGGLNQSAKRTGCGQTDQQAFSSAYIFDGSSGSGAWTKVGLMNTARAAASTAVLPDGRVLIVGGYYQNGAVGSLTTDPSAALAVYHPGAGPSLRPGGPELDDVAPSKTLPPLATAEILDPASGAWSRTGPMTFARFGAGVVTLADGRVLVVGSSGMRWLSMADAAIEADERAFGTAEIYDPATGKFQLTGPLPAIDRAAFEASKVPVPAEAPAPSTNGTLIALADGGALLVGHEAYWKNQGSIVRSFRYNGASGAWTEVSVFAAVEDWQSGKVIASGGNPRFDAIVAKLADGRVLVAGGVAGLDTSELTSTVEVFDPVTNAWSAFPDLPAARAGGTAATLPDGSVLLVGGYDNGTSGDVSCDDVAGLRTAVRLAFGP
jgi:large repetitive protein